MVVSIILAGFVASLPNYDIVKACKEEMAIAGDASGAGGCVTEEAASRERLAKEWGDYSAAAKEECINGVIDDTSPSYVEVETCFEILYWKAHPDKDRGYQVHGKP